MEKAKEAIIKQLNYCKAIKEKYYGKDALLVRSGSWIYKVPPEVYYSAK